MRPALHCVSNVGPHHTDDNSRRETAGDGSGRLISTQRSQWFCADVCADESSKGGLQGIQCGHRPVFLREVPRGIRGVCRRFYYAKVLSSGRPEASCC